MKQTELQWFFHWSERDRFAIKAEPWDRGRAFWVNNDSDGPGCRWEAGYGDRNLGVHDSPQDALDACERLYQAMEVRKSKSATASL